MITPDPWREELAGLIALGTARGFVTYEELAERLAGIEADPTGLEAVLRALEAAGIEVRETTAPAVQGAAPTPVSQPVDTDVPSALAAYERDLARVTPLDADTESEVAVVLSGALATLRGVYARAPIEARASRSTSRGAAGAGSLPADEVTPAVLYEWAVLWTGHDSGSASDRSWVDSSTRELIRQSIQAIDEARARLVKGTMRLVFHLSRRYQDRGVELLDLIQEGNAGLLRAAQRYDPARGHAFASYATWWIRQAMARIVREQGKSFKISQEVDTDLRRISLTRRRLTQALQREPSPAELAQELGIAEGVIDRVLMALSSPLRLDAPAGDNEDGSLEGFVELSVGAKSPPDPMSSVLRAEIERVLDTLDPREQDVIRLRHGLHDGTARSLDEVAKVMRITRERARQIEERALRKLRHPTRRHRLDRLD